MPPSPEKFAAPGDPAAADARGAVECPGKWTRTPATVSCCIGPGERQLVEQRRPADAPVGGSGAAARRATHPRPPVGSARRGRARTRAVRGGAAAATCPVRRVIENHKHSNPYWTLPARLTGYLQGACAYLQTTREAVRRIRTQRRVKCVFSENPPARASVRAPGKDRGSCVGRVPRAWSKRDPQVWQRCRHQRLRHAVRGGRARDRHRGPGGTAVTPGVVSTAGRAAALKAYTPTNR